MIPKSLFSISSLLKLVYSKNIQSLGHPSCEVPELGQKAAVWNKCAFNLDPDAWYGISNAKFTHEEGVEFCESFGAKLISVTDEDLDRCAFDIIDTDSFLGYFYFFLQIMIFYIGSYFYLIVYLLH